MKRRRNETGKKPKLIQLGVSENNTSLGYALFLSSVNVTGAIRKPTDRLGEGRGSENSVLIGGWMMMFGNEILARKILCLKIH
jgi:hypothetical protein